MEGWIKLHRALAEKAIWQISTPEQKVILITLLLMANHKGNEWEWQGKKCRVEPGQFITSLENITEAAGKGITIQNVRTAITRFEKYEFLTNESTKTGRLVTITNWRVYQGEEELPNKDTNKELTKHQQRANKELTTNKNDKNDNTDKNDKKSLVDSKKNEQLLNGCSSVVNEPTNDEDLKVLSDLYYQAFNQLMGSTALGRLEPFIINMGYPVVNLAMEETIMANADNIHYTIGILQNWEKKKITTVEMAQAAIKHFREEGSNGQYRQNDGGTFRGAAEAQNQWAGYNASTIRRPADEDDITDEELDRMARELEGGV